MDNFTQKLNINIGFYKLYSKNNESCFLPMFCFCSNLFLKSQLLNSLYIEFDLSENWSNVSLPSSNLSLYGIYVY